MEKKCCVCHEVKQAGILCNTCNNTMTCTACFIAWYKKDATSVIMPPHYQKCSVCRQNLFTVSQINRPTIHTAEQFIEEIGADDDIVTGTDVTLEPEVISRMQSLAQYMSEIANREIDNLPSYPCNVKFDKDDIEDDEDQMVEDWVENRAYYIYCELRSNFDVKCFEDEIQEEDDILKYIPLLKSMTEEALPPEVRRGELLKRLSHIQVVFSLDAHKYKKREHEFYDHE